ncbi:UTP--glucose-1-phosphate uridylyltransferase [Chloroflexi bacterium TSY]|nr:UTP--glucose-1-phosphate uridylyltransferase [Chloroflexi bacterium TSY]
MSELIQIITATDPNIRNRSLESVARDATLEQLLAECAALDQFRRNSSNLYERVRALFFLYAIYRFHLPAKPGIALKGLIPYEGYEHLLKRRFEEAIALFLVEAERELHDGIASALATAYHRLGFQTLANQVRRSVRSVRGNQWMFRISHPADHPLRIRPELRRPTAASGQSGPIFPILHEATPVRMDLTHSGWSDIFFLGMDFPEGARVLNVSIDLSVRAQSNESDQSGSTPRPPVEAYLRVVDRPVLRLVSVDLGASAEITSLAEVFDFAKDYLGLLKAAVIASGIVPPGMEGAEQSLADLLERIVGTGYGLEIVSRVNNIPKGSRLAVSTNLLASLIAACMRATGQTGSLTGQLLENERRVVAARAILGEWLGGSGGGWQDSGGVWPGMKLIEGVEAEPADPEYGISRGRLLPSHHILSSSEVLSQTRQALQDSLVLVHGGMAQDVGPILEMVTEKYLLRSEAEWNGRQTAMRLYDQIVELLKKGDVSEIGRTTHQNFEGPIQTIIPWASNQFTETLIERVRDEFGERFWGFWMLGGMSGGGMGFIFEPTSKPQAQKRLQVIMSETKKELESAVPFAMEPVVYDFMINENGTFANLMTDEQALMPPQYYALIVPELIRREQHTLSPFRRSELDRFAKACRTRPELSYMVRALFDRLLPSRDDDESVTLSLDTLLEQYGFDHQQHEQIRADLRSGRIGLAQNRLPVRSRIEDIAPHEVVDIAQGLDADCQRIGDRAIAAGEVAVVSLAGGAGSRWTQGAGVVKALNPFARLNGKHRNFIEVHLAKSRRVSQQYDNPLPHVITTSYLTHEPIRDYLAANQNYHYPGPLYLSQGRVVGLRMVPMTRDLRFAWEEMPQQLLDEQAQKVQESLHAALINWAEQAGEGNDYTDNLPNQCLHPVGHWYEVPNMLRNGTMQRLLMERPQLKYLMVHNIDTLGADVDVAILGHHIHSGAALTTEVITRRIEDRGGGLAKIDGRLRLIEGLALPREDIEFELSYYNSSTTWVDIDQLLTVFELDRKMLTDEERVADAVRSLAARMPTYVTLKDVKKRWGKGQEDVFPVAQFEKLWGDMTLLSNLDSRFVVVPRSRGQQLKEVAQLDGWLRDGSAAYLESLCVWK